MSGLFNVGHVAQLNEIQNARLKARQPGIGPEVEELIRRLTSGGVAGKTDDVRTMQAKRLWDIGVGSELGYDSFKQYLDGGVSSMLGDERLGIPEIPEALLRHDSEFHLLFLVEPRVGLKSMCAVGGIDFEGSDETFVAHDARHAEFTQPTWIRIQDGRKNQNRTVRDCRKTFGVHELGLTALQGVCAYIHHPTVVSEVTQEGAHVMDLSGSVLRGDRDVAACLGLWQGRPRLSWDWCVLAVPKYGSASRGECQVL